MKFVCSECESKKVTIRIILDAGCSVEYPNIWTSGMSHLLEHLICQGTNNLDSSELFSSFAMLGADLEAYTWHTKVSFSVTVLFENAVKATELLYDMLIGRKFEQKTLDMEKLVILEEEKGCRDNVDVVISEKLNNFLCDGPLSVPIIGNKRSIKSINLDEVNNFYNYYYNIDRMLMVVTGPKETDFDKIKNVFGGDGKFIRSKKEKNTYTKRKKLVVYDGRVNQSRLFVCYRAFTKRNKRLLTLNFLSKILANGLESRLFCCLRQKHGLCYDVGSYIDSYDDVGWYNIYVQTSKENVDKAIKLINKEVKIFISDGPTENEMLGARNRYLSEIYDAIETSNGLNAIISGKVFNGLSPISDTISRINSMTARKVKNVGNIILNNNNKQTFICMPE